MTIAVVGAQTGGTFANNVTSVSRAFPGSVTAGNMLVIICAKFSEGSDPFLAADCTKSSGTATIGTISLDRTREIQADVSPVGWASIAIYSCLVTGSGTATFQVAGLPTGSYAVLASIEASGSWDASRLETGADNASATDGTTSGGSGNATSAGAALFVGGLQLNTSGDTTITPDAAFTQIYEHETGSTDATGSAIYQIVSSGTTDAADWTFGATNGGWAIALAVYKEAAGGGGSSTPPFPSRVTQIAVSHAANF